MRRNRWSVLVAMWAVATVAAFVAVPSEAQTAPKTPPPYSSTAASSAASQLLYMPGAPGTATLVDLGTPGANVSMDSLGTGTAYAALPAPGDLINGATGLLTGLLSLGAFGLPPIDLPTLPPYPLAVSSDVNGPTDARLGDGPYSLAAHSTPNAGTATASGGLHIDALGSAAHVSATASTTVNDDGSVVSTATGSIEGVTIGPVQIGRVSSTATMTLAPDGTITPSMSATIAALSIGQIPIEINTQGLNIGGTPVPLPIGTITTALLKSLGLTVEVKPARVQEGQANAPALVITLPVPAIEGVSSGPGSFTLTFGNASVTMKGATARTLPATPPPVPVTPFTPDPAVTPTISALPSDARGSQVNPTPTTAPAVVSGRPTAAAAPPGPLDLWSVRILYLAASAGGLGAYALTHLIRLVGVRKRWISTAG